MYKYHPPHIAFLVKAKMMEAVRLGRRYSRLQACTKHCTAPNKHKHTHTHNAYPYAPAYAMRHVLDYMASYACGEAHCALT